MKVLRRVGLAIVGFFILISCHTPDTISPEYALEQNLMNADQDRLVADIKIIDDSLANWGILPLIEPHGVRYTIDSVGVGPKPSLKSTIICDYVGTLMDNVAIDTQADFSAILYNLILGWQATLPLISQGSKITLYLPSPYAYGTRIIKDNNGVDLVPANSILIFKIKLKEVK